MREHLTKQDRKAEEQMQVLKVSRGSMHGLLMTFSRNRAKSNKCVDRFQDIMFFGMNQIQIHTPHFQAKTAAEKEEKAKEDTAN